VAQRRIVETELCPTSLTNNTHTANTSSIHRQGRRPRDDGWSCRTVGLAFGHRVEPQGIGHPGKP
jgi:hypothetical protein